MGKQSSSPIRLFENKQGATTIAVFQLIFQQLKRLTIIWGHYLSKLVW